MGGIFDQGCKKQFPGHEPGDFDCDNNYGGRDTKSGCSRLPKALQAGCEWRYDWYRWLAAGGQTNNPYVQFRRTLRLLRLHRHLAHLRIRIRTRLGAKSSVAMGSKSALVIGPAMATGITTARSPVAHLF